MREFCRPADPIADLDSVVATAELSGRPSRSPDYEAENRALVALAEEMPHAPKDILQRFVETALALCRAGSAGISILEEENGKKIFRWHALAGELASHLMGTTPRDFSPCGTVLDRNSIQLFSGLDRHFQYFAEVKPRILEALLVPFAVAGIPVGTIWVVTHDDCRRFDAEDGRVLTNLGKFVAAAYQLRSSLEALKKADRSKDEFLAILAHELRNPLAPMHHAVEYLAHAATPQPETEAAQEIIRRQLHQMTRLIDDLLDITRASQGKMEMAPVRFELVKVLQQAVEASRPLIDASQHNLTMTLPSSPVHVEADPIRLAQIVANLVNNAAKYTKEGGHIQVTVEVQGHEVAIKVCDNGIGIAADMLPRIFDLYTQVDRRNAQAQGGLGIGLALVKRLVQMHGGCVTAQSAGIGLGSEFRVRLPIVAGSAAAIASKPRGTKKPIHEPHLRILVVDDNGDSAESLAMLLRAQGHDVRTAYDGPSALRVAADLSPQAVLQDIGLPGMSGYELARALRKLSPAALLVAVSGYGQDDDFTRSKEAGFDHHLVKPVDFDALSELIGSVARVEGTVPRREVVPS